jgi:hypothetical protein
VLQHFRHLNWRQFVSVSISVSVVGSLISLSAGSGLAPAVAAVQGLGREAPAGASAKSKTAPNAAPGAVSLNQLRRPLQDGVYLFGDAATPNQQQRSYFVFQVENQRVIGAVYTPGSSFDCFYGTQKPGNLEVQVFDSYDATYYPQSVVLTDYYSLPKASVSDRQLLNACRAAVPVAGQTQAQNQAQPGLK